MEFPSRSGGAQGGLIKGNLFAQSGAPVFSHTKHGDSVIHTVNGRISITRDKKETPQPYLLLPYYRNGRPRLLRTAAEAVVPEIDAPVDQLPAQTVTGRGVFVGDGYFLCLERSADMKTSRPILLSIDGPEAPLVGATTPGGSPSAANVMGANVQLNTPWLMDYARPDGNGEVFPSCMATGWRDETRRYGFAVFGLMDDGETSVRASRYACIVGNTGTRTATVHILPKPEEKPYKASWWGVEAIYAPSTTIGGIAPFSARCYCVGLGHLLTLLTPQELIASREDGPSGGGYEHFSHNWLLPGSAPYLLRSRDFGETWTMERADFLVADEAPTTTHYLTESADDFGAPFPLQRVGEYGYFIATPMGDGRVAIAALGKNKAMPAYDVFTATGHPINSVADRSWRFYVSNTLGTGFTNKPWPMDDMRAAPPHIVFDATYAPPRVRSYEHPTFDARVSSQRTYSFGPGHFIFPTIRYGVDLGYTAEYDWGTYPADYPVTVWTTHDAGATWAAERMPDALVPHANGLAAYYLAHPKPPFEPYSDAWATGFLAFGCTEPASADGKPVLTYTRWNFNGAADVFVSDDPDAPISSLVRVAGLPALPVEPGASVTVHDYSIPSTWRNSNTNEVFYTGDLRNPQYPELVYPGYQEFEEP